MDRETHIDPRATYARIETDGLVSTLKDLYELARAAKRAGHHTPLASVDADEVAGVLTLLADPDTDAATRRSMCDSVGETTMLAAVVETYEQICDDLARRGQDKPIYRSSLHTLLAIAGRTPTILPALDAPVSLDSVVAVDNDHGTVEHDRDPSSHDDPELDDTAQTEGTPVPVSNQSDTPPSVPPAPGQPPLSAYACAPLFGLAVERPVAHALSDSATGNVRDNGSIQDANDAAPDLFLVQGDAPSQPTIPGQLRLV